MFLIENSMQSGTFPKLRHSKYPPDTVVQRQVGGRDVCNPQLVSFVLCVWNGSESLAERFFAEDFSIVTVRTRNQNYGWDLIYVLPHPDRLRVV
uniref:Uncharacterized protein n=1 Tax=Anguilla anguilla TaxID=7936 RepID=A0A0E9WEX8_ANGAN